MTKELTINSLKLKDVKHYIDTHFDQDLRLADMASMSNMATSTFSRRFRAQFGIAFRDYVVEQRLNYALQELISTDEQI